jgi:hypothetical protein
MLLSGWIAAPPLNQWTSGASVLSGTVLMLHVGGTRSVTSSTHDAKTGSDQLLTVECIRTCIRTCIFIFLCLFMFVYV